MTEDSTPSLYDWAGGSAAFRAMIDAFYNRVEEDDLLGPLFPGGVSEEHRRNVSVWWIEVFGGPADYSETLGGYERMLAHHRNLGITADQRFRFASLMSLAADDAGLPDDPEFRAALVGYLVAGTLVVAAGLRAVLPRDTVGGLMVRSRLWDVVTLVVLAAAVTGLAATLNLPG